jgi:Leu/Phe-tRNA-protein transferase
MALKHEYLRQLVDYHLNCAFREELRKRGWVVSINAQFDEVIEGKGAGSLRSSAAGRHVETDCAPKFFKKSGGHSTNMLKQSQGIAVAF